MCCACLRSGDGEIGADEMQYAIENHILADWYHHLVDYDPGGSMLSHFQKFDTDGDGVVSFDEFCKGFGVDINARQAPAQQPAGRDSSRKATPEGTPSAAELYALFQYLDTDGSESICGQEVACAIKDGALLEWYAFMQDFMPGSSVFEYFDKNGCVHQELLCSHIFWSLVPRHSQSQFETSCSVEFRSLKDAFWFGCATGTVPLSSTSSRCSLAELSWKVARAAMGAPEQRMGGDGARRAQTNTQTTHKHAAALDKSSECNPNV